MTRRSGVLLALLLTLPEPLAAHALNPGLLEIADLGGGHYTVLWKAPRAATLDSVPAVLSPSGLQPVFPASCLVREQQLRSRRSRGVALLDLDCGSSLLGAVSFAGDEGLPTEVLVRWVAANGRETTELVRGADAEVILPGSTPRSRLETLASYAALGLAHIATGFDHLLFVGCLLLLATRLRTLIASITAFTAAHSLTLVLATTGWVRAPLEPVEILIAASVVLAAAEAVRTPHGGRPRAPTRAWSMAFAFGLLHGLGFAGVLADAGLPAERVPSALLGFNLGVEAGQLAFVSLVWWPLRAGLELASRLPTWTAALPAYAIGCVAAVWTAERISGAL